MKTIIFDFDGTLTKRNNEIWRRIWKKLDAIDVDDILYDRFNNNEITYHEWCVEIEKEFIKRKLNTEIMNELIASIEMMDNLEDTLIELKSKGYDLRILSGGIDYVINTLLKDNIKYFSDIRTNKFYFDEKGLLTRIEETDSDGKGKARYILNYIKESGCHPSDIIFIGNGNNDRFVSQSGCHTICLNPHYTNHEDKNIWHNYIDSTNDLRDILKTIEEIETTKKTKKI